MRFYPASELGDRGVFNANYVQQLLSQHMLGLNNYTDQLWIILNFEIWARIFLDEQGWNSVSEDVMAMAG